MRGSPTLETWSSLRDVERRPTTVATSAVLLAWSTIIALGVVCAVALEASGHAIAIGAPPLHARFDFVLHSELLVVIVVGALAVTTLPTISEQSSWHRVLWSGAGGSALFGVALASTRGWDRIVEPVTRHREYLAVVPRVGDVGHFLATFTRELPSYPVHVQGHPPGVVLLAWGLHHVGLGAPAWFAAVLIAGGALVVPSALMVVRDVAGERWARAAMPFLVVTPTAIWLVTSADALFAGVGAAGVALVVVATGRRDRTGDGLALVGGVVLGVAAFLSYGLVLVAVIPLVVAWHRHAIRALAFAAAGAAAVAMAFLGVGFWWLDGLEATRGQYLAGIASRRPYLPFVAIDAAAFAVALGPAVAVGIARLRNRRMWIVVGSGLVAVALAAATGMAKGEVERIWLPFAPWLLVACAALASGGSSAAASGEPIHTPRRAVTLWLAAQLAFAVLLESFVLTPW